MLEKGCLKCFVDIVDETLSAVCDLHTAFRGLQITLPNEGNFLGKGAQKQCQLIQDCAYCPWGKVRFVSMQVFRKYFG